jgi:hypothetical protein
MIASRIRRFVRSCLHLMGPSFDGTEQGRDHVLTPVAAPASTRQDAPPLTTSMPPMDERTDIPPPHHRIRFELIFASVWLAIGLFFLPALIFWVGISMLGPYGEGQGAGMGTFYGDFYGDLATGEIRAWALALGPLVLITALRAIFIGTRPRHPALEAHESPAPTPKTADPRRVEPRIGAE